VGMLVCDVGVYARVLRSSTHWHAAFCCEAVTASGCFAHLSMKLSQNTPSTKASGSAALSLAAASASVRPVANLNEVLAPAGWAVRKFQWVCQWPMVFVPCRDREQEVRFCAPEDGAHLWPCTQGCWS
jgi:hypothetical protein